ncbi:hypothetical protein ACN38_g4365 [Penicillium nordicum]|uniref:Uncharacterized protein n=1 Tax=Penicillium nordicum TaxID=229535 RepID=A0A0M8PBF8_9EURO|nr:hypothetical protein ACN38_g4365 [Penicillium nordicum]
MRTVEPTYCTDKQKQRQVLLAVSFYEKSKLVCPMQSSRQVLQNVPPPPPQKKAQTVSCIVEVTHFDFARSAGITHCFILGTEVMC